jgi:hypothetical protein
MVQPAAGQWPVPRDARARVATGAVRCRSPQWKSNGSFVRALASAKAFSRVPPLSCFTSWMTVSPRGESVFLNPDNEKAPGGVLTNGESTVDQFLDEAQFESYVKQPALPARSRSGGCFRDFPQGDHCGSTRLDHRQIDEARLVGRVIDTLHSFAVIARLDPKDAGYECLRITVV